MLIRRFTHEDAQACCDVINACVPSMQGLNNAARFHIISKNVPSDLCADLKADFTLVGELHHQIVAVGSLITGEIRRVYVSPDLQGHGIGKAMVDALEAEARKRGETQLTLESSPSSLAFYEHLGYRRVGDARHVIGAAVFEFVRMSKVLAEQAAV